MVALERGQAALLHHGTGVLESVAQGRRGVVLGDAVQGQAHVRDQDVQLLGDAILRVSPRPSVFPNV